MRSTTRDGLPRPEATNDRLVVAITGAPGNEALVRRAARIAERSGAGLIGIHVRVPDGPADIDPTIDVLRRLVSDLGGAYREVVGDDVASALVSAARAEGAREIVMGTTRRGWPARVLGGSIERRVIGSGDNIDVRVVASGWADGGQSRRVPRRRFSVGSPRARRRILMSWWVATAALVTLTWILTTWRADIDLASALLLYLLVVVGIAALGGRLVSFVTAVASFLLANWYLTPPLYTWKIAHTENVVALVAFVTVAVVVSNFVAVASRRAAESERARAEAESLARLSAAHADADPLATVITHLRATFSLDGVSVLRQAPDGSWVVEARAGGSVPMSPDGATFTHGVGPGVVLAGIGRRLSEDDQRVLRAFAAQLAAALERADLACDAARAELLERTNALRTTLLQSLSHDLRTPLATIKVSVSSLRDLAIDWPDEQRAEFLASIENETDHLTRVVSNLVDLGRIQTGALRPGIRPVSLEEVVPAAVHSLGSTRVAVQIDLPEDLPDVAADPPLLERVVANLASNAVRFSPADECVRISARLDEQSLLIEVADHGPGIAADQREAVVRPFHRLDDSRRNGGVGLGLAIANGFTEAMHGELLLLDTPGGGLTVRVRIPVAGRPAPIGAGCPAPIVADSGASR